MEREYFFGKIILVSGTLPKRILEFEASNNVVYEYRHLPRHIESLAIFGAGDAAFDGALKALENEAQSVQQNRQDKSDKKAQGSSRGIWSDLPSSRTNHQSG